MLHFTDVTKAQELCECLASPARLEILRLVLERKADSLDYLAKTLHMTNGAITQHIKKLCDAGLVKLEATAGKRGTAKRCVPIADRIIIDIAADLETESERVFDLGVGSFSSAQVKPYCAIAGADGFIGERDDPRYFTYPSRTAAFLVYFNSGRLTYTLPVPPEKTKPKSISVSLELSSKPYGYGRSRESAVAFFLNDARLGEHTVSGEFTDRKGLFTPTRYDDCCQYGKLKTIRIDERGSFFDGVKIGNTTVSDIDASALYFSLSTESGVALFGKGYGDYDCGIKVRYEY